MRKLVVLVSLLVAGSAVASLGSPAPAQPARSAQAAAPGYQCAPPSSLTTTEAGKPRSLAVRFDGYTVTYTAKPAHLDIRSLSYPGVLKVTGAGKSWVVPRPADPKDQYFELGELCAVRFASGASGVAGTAPDVLAEGYSGGAHCCYGPTIYQYSDGRYRVVDDLTKPGVGKGLHWNPNGGFQLKHIAAAVVLASSDGAFPYTFGCYACTPAPTRLFTIAGGRLVDVTRKYPAIISAEAASAWSLAAQAMRSPGDYYGVEGPLAEWAADKCELNEGAQMWRMLEQLQAQGKLTAAEQHSFGNKGPFPALLKAFLLKEGYCQGQLG